LPSFSTAKAIVSASGQPSSLTGRIPFFLLCFCSLAVAETEQETEYETEHETEQKEKAERLIIYVRCNNVSLVSITVSITPERSPPGDRPVEKATGREISEGLEKQGPALLHILF
jgi:hypothetical protein